MKSAVVGRGGLTAYLPTHRPLGVPMRPMVVLSVLLTVYALSLLLPEPSNVYDAPVFQVFREADGTFFTHGHLRKDPILYAWLHAVPAVLWCICMPLQHVRSIRRNRINVHRWSGRIAILCSLLLSLSGFLFSTRGIALAADIWHVHKLKVGSDPATSLTLLAWPSAHIWARGSAPTLAFSAYMTYHYARKGDIVNHQRWAELCTFIGYVVPLERVVLLLNLILAYILPLLPGHVRAYLQVPETFLGKHQAESAAFSFSVWSASVLMALYMAVKIHLQRRNASSAVQKAR